MSKFKWSILCFILVFSASADALKCANEFNTTSSSRIWMSLQDAKALMQSQGIKTSTEFNEWKKAGKRPEHFPSNPQRTYKKEWISWSHFLGNEKQWMSFNEAQTFIQSQGIKTRKEFDEWKKAGKRPEHFPSHPERVYTNEWRGWRDFLDTKWMSFDQAKAFIQRQGIRTREQFYEWSKSKKRPKDFPSNPNQMYKDKWKGWGDFLDTKWMSFDQAQALMQSQGIKTKREFREWSKSKKRPKNFPSTPDQVYTNEWRGWGDFLGTGNTSTKNNGQTSFDEIKAFLQRLGVRTYIESEEEEQVSIKPENFPSTSDEASKDTQTDPNSFLESETTWMSFDDAKEYVRPLNFENHKDFIDWLKSSDRPENFPPNPQQVYSEWISLKDFLSTKEYMTYKEAKTFVQQLGITNQRDFFEEKKNNSDIFPENFPPNPKAFYTNTGEWIDWNDFLGLTNKSHNRSNNSGENSQIEGGKLGQEDIFTDAEEGSKWGENVEI